ncbi:MAG: hypothetical protein ACYSR0_12360 [Planctomycetota bacterium]|jgi:hypothetical protein
MNGKRAKQIKRLVYGDSFSPRHRKYSRAKGTTQIVADDRRQRYQKLKRLLSGGSERVKLLRGYGL